MKYLILPVLVAIALAAYFVLQPRQQVAAFDAVKPRVEEISLTLEETGRVVNDRVVKLTSLVNGRIVSTRFNIGDHVNAEEIVATFDTDEVDALHKKALAETVRDQHAVDNAALKLSRIEELAASSSSSKQALDDARYELRAAQANLEVAQSNLRIFDIRRQQSILKTPYAGIVIDKTSEAGQWMEAGTLLYTLVADEGFEIEVKIDSSELGNFDKELIAELHIEDQPEQRWQAPIHWISPSIGSNENASDNSFSVRLPISEDAPALLLNQQVQVVIPLKTAKDALTVPVASLLSTGDGNEVARVVDGKVERIAVTVGIETINRAQIVSGIDGDATIILPRGKNLANGQSVEINAAQ